MKHLLENKKIAIIGGGPGGLTLARFLQMEGADVKVYERDASKASRVQGAIVDLHFESGLKVIEKAGLMEAFKVNYLQGADKYRVFDKDGNMHLDEHDRENNEHFGDERFRPEIDRGSLRNILLDALHPDTVVWDMHFVSMVPAGDGWLIHFKNGTSANADLVVGCDGARSKVRAYVTDIQPLYAGFTIIQGEIDHPATACPEIFKLVANGNLIVLSDGKSIIAQPRGDGGLTFYAGGRYPENWGKHFTGNEAIYNFLHTYYSGWNEQFLKFFKATDHLVIRPLNYFPLDQDWKARSNITIIGDAAHLMPPSGEGVNTAMLDAMDLSEYLANREYNHIQSAIAAFEQHMRARSRQLTQEALEDNEVMYGEHALETLLKRLNGNGN